MQQEIIYKPFTPDFLIVPYQLFTDKRLDKADALVYGLIYWFEHLKDGKCTASNATVAGFLNMHPSTIANSIGRLCKYGYINILFADEKKTSRLEISTNISYKLSPTGEGVNPQAKGASLAGEGGFRPQINRESNTNRVIEPSREALSPIKEKSFNGWKDIDEELLVRISEEYEVPLDFVKDCHETAGNWLKAKGKRMQDYNAFFRNWVKREKASYLLKSRGFGNRRGGVMDARTK